MAKPPHPGAEIVQPETLHEALVLLDEGSRNGRPWIPLAISNTLASWCQAQGVHLERVLDLRRLGGLAGVSESEGELHLGPLVSYRELRGAAAVHAHAPALLHAAVWYGAKGSPSQPTLGGSVVDGLPSGELVTVLAAYHAELTLVSNSGLRSVALADFYDDQGQSLAHSDELLLRVSVPKPNPNTRVGYMRVGVHGSEGWSCVSAGLRMTWDGTDGAVADGLLVVGGLERVPVWMLEPWAEALKGTQLKSDTTQKARMLVEASLGPMMQGNLSERLGRLVERRLRRWGAEYRQTGFT